MPAPDKKKLFKLLKDAPQSLADAHDKELAERLSMSVQATEQGQWNRKLIAGLLAKAGKTKDAEQFALAAELHWERAEALLNMAQALWCANEKETAMSLMKSAAEQADQGQDAAQQHSQLDASSVLGEIAVAYAEFGAMAEARKLVAKITDITRKARASEKLLEIAPQEETRVAEVRGKQKSSNKQKSSKAKKSGRKRN